jgi:hypothetical protein
MTAVGNLSQIALENIVEHVVAAGFAVEQDTGTVVGKAVVADFDGAVWLERRKVGTDADAAIDDFIVSR